MAEKKLENVNVRMCESMLDTIDGLANSAGMNRSEWISIVLSSAIEKERQQYLALHSIFGSRADSGNENGVAHRNTPALMSEMDDK